MNPESSLMLGTLLCDKSRVLNQGRRGNIYRIIDTLCLSLMRPSLVQVLSEPSLLSWALLAYMWFYGELAALMQEQFLKPPHLVTHSWGGYVQSCGFGNVSSIRAAVDSCEGCLLHMRVCVKGSKPGPKIQLQLRHALWQGVVSPWR